MHELFDTPRMSHKKDKRRWKDFNARTELCRIAFEEDGVNFLDVNFRATQTIDILHKF